MIHWFKRHPKHLANESRALSNDTNYKELYQIRNNLFVSHGYVLVRLETTFRFPILVVYPESTPYVLPAIYPLKSELTKQEVESIAQGTFGQVFLAIKDQVEYYYHLRHQNQTGSLCILEWDNLDDGFKFYGITTILKRVKDWFRGTKTNEFPPDSQEVEYYAHFVNVSEDLKLLYPSQFLDTKLMDGETYSLLFGHRQKGKYYRSDRTTYFGCLMIGKTSAGLYENVNYNLPNFFFEEGIFSSLELIEKKGIVDRLIKEGRLMRSYWFQLNHEPTPFKQFSELIAIIGEGDYNSGVQRMFSYFKNGEQIEKPDALFVSVRFANRKGEQEFQLFKISRNDTLTGGLVGVSELQAFEHFLQSYDVVQAVQSEKFTDETYHLRNSGRADRRILKDSVVNIVGVGALGSEIADSMGKAGIGKIMLFDSQEMKGPNPVRHLAGLSHIGFAKVEAVASVIADHNPFVEVYPLGADINSFDINRFEEDSITVSSIADDNTEGFLNERAVIGNKTVYYSRALRGGKVARIFRVIPGKDACFHCLELYRRDNSEFISIPEDETLPTLKTECNNPVRPASAADLKFISAMTSKILIEEMQNGFGETNQWIWSSEKLGILEPFRLHHQCITPHPKCFYCNHDKHISVFCHEELIKKMQQLVAEDTTIETGGVLAGFIREDGNYEITAVSGPGPKAVKTATRFEKDVEYCQAFLDNEYSASNKKTIYLGEWHSHPSLKNYPSGTDLNSLSDISFQKEYLTEMPVMIILSNIGTPSCTLHPAGKRFYFSNLEITK